MNRYKDALTYLRNSALVTDHKQKEKVNQCTEVLQELVDKEIPKKWDFFEYEEKIQCPSCLHTWNVIDNCTETFEYCPNCGKKT